MAEITFSSVFAVICDNIQARVKDKIFGEIFYSYFEEYDKSDVATDYTANKILSGRKAPTEKCKDFYRNADNFDLLTNDISENLLPYISQKFGLCSTLKDMIITSSMHDGDKESLLKYYPYDESGITVFIAKVIIFAMNNPAKRPDNSPIISERIILPVISPCKHFSGREKELRAFSEMLEAHDKVFLYGIGGIGKSEFVKKYISEHKKDYTNILYTTYSESIKNTIASINFKSDKQSDTIEQLYSSHIEYLSLLKNDTLIIIDNFDILPETDDDLETIMNLHAKIIFTTRNNFGDEYDIFELNDIDRSALFEIADKMKLTNVDHDILDRIFAAAHDHTLACGLIIRLLKKSAHSADEILKMLMTSHVNIDANDKIRRNKTTDAAKYSKHIHQLFRLFSLSNDQQRMMRLLSLVPVAGISDTYFQVLTSIENFDTINELDEIGLIRYDNHIISVHPLIGEAAAFDLTPDMDNCYFFIQVLNLEFQHHLATPINYLRQEVILEIADRIVEFARKNDIEYYFLFLINACPYAEVFEDELRMKLYMSEMEKYLPYVKDNLSKAVYFTAKASYAMIFENDKDAAIEFETKAIEFLHDTPQSHREVAICFNIYNSLGAFYLEKGDIPRAELCLMQAKAVCEICIPIEEFPALVDNLMVLEEKKITCIQQNYFN